MLHHRSKCTELMRADSGPDALLGFGGILTDIQEGCEMRKTAIVTGCTRGIGNAIASALAKEGYAVAGIGSSPEEKVKEGLDRIRQYQEDFLYVRGSITDPLIRERLLNETLHRFGRLDLLVNNAALRLPSDWIFWKTRKKALIR